MLREYLGAHRLEDLQHPEHLSQLALAELQGEFSPLKTLDRHTHNLPIQPTPLLGREELVRRSRRCWFAAMCDW